MTFHPAPDGGDALEALRPLLMLADASDGALGPERAGRHPGPAGRPRRGRAHRAQPRLRPLPAGPGRGTAGRRLLSLLPLPPTRRCGSWPGPRGAGARRDRRGGVPLGAQRARTPLPRRGHAAGGGAHGRPARRPRPAVRHLSGQGAARLPPGGAPGGHRPVPALRAPHGPYRHRPEGLPRRTGGSAAAGLRPAARGAGGRHPRRFGRRPEPLRLPAGGGLHRRPVIPASAAATWRAGSPGRRGRPPATSPGMLFTAGPGREGEPR